MSLLSLFTVVDNDDDTFFSFQIHSAGLDLPSPKSDSERWASRIMVELPELRASSTGTLDHRIMIVGHGKMFHGSAI